MSMEEGIINDEDEFGDEEYVAVNSMLDQINSYLDDLEEKNDALNGKLVELLESNRQARMEFRAQLLGSASAEEGQNGPVGVDDKVDPEEDDSEGSQMKDKSE